jgi:hypothetical protein
MGAVPNEGRKMASLATPIAMWVGLLGIGAGEEGYKNVKPVIYQKEVKEVPDIWALEFVFRNPRYILVDIPGKGRKLVWYMTYKVINRTGAPRVFMPSFELVTDKGQVYQDSILPRAELAVKMREDPTQPLFNPIQMASKPIDPTPKESAPIVRRGVVFWEDVDMSTKTFTIFVTGLSNGYHKVDDPNAKGKEKLLRKTLKLDFTKYGDVYNNHEKEIKFSGEPTWVYR